jgi:hypothetical protein
MMEVQLVITGVTVMPDATTLDGLNRTGPPEPGGAVRGSRGTYMLLSFTETNNCRLID